MIFLTVGSRYGFDRLVRAVDGLVERGVIADEVVAQIGVGAYEPTRMRFERFIEGPEYDRLVQDADALIGHAGSGTIQLATQHGKALLVMPRRKRFKEHVNDHQVATARTFARLGQVLCADDETELAARVAELGQFVPRRRIADVDGLAERIGDFLRSIS